MLKHGILGKFVSTIACFIIANLLVPALPIMFWFVVTPLALAWGIMSSGLTWSKNEDRYKA